MKQCSSCGGELIPIGDNKLYCSYCGNVYNQDDTSKAVPMNKNEIKKYDIGSSVFEDNIHSVLEIRWISGPMICSGSGLIISSDGYAITNTHVVTSEDGKSCGSCQINYGGKTGVADVIKLGDSNHGLGNGIDLALIKIRDAKGLAPVRFADFESVKIGEQVYVIGNSLGYGTCITSGIVSDKRRKVDNDMLLMTDCAINGGNSGGPMFNAKGEVIAVIVSGIDGAEGMNFAIPADDVINFINSCNCNISIK